MIKLSQSTPTAGDCTAGYSVSLDKEYTVDEFIKEVLTNKEWGYIGIHNEGQAWFSRGNPNCEYRGDKLITEMDKDFLNHKVKAAKASGGYSRMDYTIYI